MAIKELDKIIEVNEEEIPLDLKNVDNWVLWRGEWNDKQQTYSKIPYSTKGYKASSTNSKTWDKFIEAYTELEVNEAYQGIGIVLSENNNLVCLDIDNAIDDYGQINSDLAIEMTKVTYCETSPSGTGLHCFFKGELPEKRKKKRSDLDIELYDSKRFMTVTGYSIGQSKICDDQKVLNNLVEQYFKEDESITYSDVVDSETSSNLSDEEIINIMLRSKQKEKIRDLLKGNYENYFDSPSEAVHSLLHFLAFYTAKKKQQMERIFLNYNQLTDKWYSKRGNTTWGELELDKAIKNTKEVYRSNQNNFSEFDIIPQENTDIKELLNQLGNNERANMIKKWTEEGRHGRKPSTISPNKSANLLNECMKFILFDDEENTKLAMYLYDEGVYTQKVNKIYRVISYLEPKYNQTKSDEVIFHLKKMVPIKSKTNSPDLIPVENGIFNRKTKQLENFTPDYVFTTKINTPYVEMQQAPYVDGWNVDTWIKEIACYDTQVVNLLWQVINDSLNGNYTRKKAIFLVGGGNNGKGTFQELLINLIGFSNLAFLKVNEFDERFRISDLEGKTAVIGDDVQPNIYIDDSSKFNSVITGDPVSVERKNQPVYNSVFRCTVIQSSNGMPKFRNKTNGTIRRLLIVPFNADFNGSVENSNIKEKFVKDELILQYVLYKAINLEFDKFDIPNASKQLLEEFKQDNDPIYEFKINIFDNWKIRKIPKYIVYDFYKQFCIENGYKSVKSRTFHKQFESYLSNNWNTNAQRRFDIEELEEKIPDFNLHTLDTAPIEKGKNYKSYENEKLKAI